MWQYCGLPPATKAELIAAGLPGDALPEGDLAYPVFTRLPMGLSHSVLIMQTLHEEALRREPKLANLGTMRNSKPSPVLRDCCEV